MNLEKKQLLPVNQIKTIEKNALLHDWNMVESGVKHHIPKPNPENSQ
jgi:hypothetical protein